MTGILATSEGCAAFGISNPGGAIDGNGRQVLNNSMGNCIVSDFLCCRYGSRS